MIRKVQWTVIILCILTIFGLYRSVVDLWFRRDILDVRQKELTALTKEQEQLKKQLEFANTNLFIEREARERLGWSKPGEVVVLVEGKESQDRNEILREAGPNWKQWWELFF